MTPPPASLSSAGPRAPAARRLAARVIAIVAAALVLLAIFAAYRQPGFVLDFANLLLC